MNYRPLLISCCLSLVALPGARAQSPVPLIKFNRDIRPLLADNCFACHGPDKNKRKADLRLDTAQGMFTDRGGYAAVEPGKPEQSELYRRISTADKKQMPPAKSGKHLSKGQIEQIRQWIVQGGNWERHWSLIAPLRPVLPTVHAHAWPRNAIDFFILERLEREALHPSAEAERRTLIRRLAFDLTGLPPAPEQVDAFLADQSPDAYEKLVDQFLAAPAYGERMALYWLDLVRYADTGGYHSDNHRDVSLYRDYVIKAFNDNKPFDGFTIEQLAGDLLPEASRESKIASGYNRLLMTTEEGGAQAKEYLAKYAADRVRNVSSVWLGTTLGCSECHDHKFDPFLTREFYQFEAFFADLKEIPVGRQEQVKVPIASQETQLQQLDAKLAPLRKVLETPTPEIEAGQRRWEEQQRSVPPAPGVKGGPPPDVQKALAVDAAKRTAAQKLTLAKYYRTIAPQLEAERKQLADFLRQKDALNNTIPSTLVSMAVTPRVMRVLPRGNWLDDSGEIVSPAVPAMLPPLGVKERRGTRLDLARWMVAGDQPLVARVFVNRLWKLMFGQGIVKTLDDFGTQGAPPTHAELLDWLAVEFRDSGWNIKHMLKLMVMSSSYRQTSTVSEHLRQRDPYNALLARQARFRLDAEMVRDNALAVSGLLARHVGGPSVKPYQPAGYWSYLNFPRREYQNDQGLSLYRRGLYTYWQRSFLHPSLLAFDAPSREECTVERPRSNTPLQALVLLNDPSYVEAARVLAERIIRAGGAGEEARVKFAFRQVLCRPPQPPELRVLISVYANHLKEYQADLPAAKTLLAIGDYPVAKHFDTADVAAWTSVARVILNLHETITRN